MTNNFIFTATPATDSPEDANINWLNMQDYFGPSGVPLGGIGAGYIQLNPAGVFTRNGINNIHHSNVDTPAGMFLTMWEDGKAVRLQRDNTQAYGMTAYEHSSYQGLYPRAELGFSGNNSVSTQVSYKAYSGLTPQNVKDSSMPVIWFEVTLNNPSGEAKNVSTALSWADMIGRGLRDTNRYGEPGFNQDADSNYWHWMTPPETVADDYTVDQYVGVHQYAKDRQALVPEKWTHQNYNTDVTVLAEKQDGAEISVLKSYSVNNQDAFSEYKQNGSFSSANGPVALSNGGAENQVQNASAVAVKTQLQPGETKTVRFMVSWFMPEPDLNKIEAGAEGSFLPGNDYIKFYHSYAQDITELNQYAV